MINFEEELKNFQPCRELAEGEEEQIRHELTDVIDLLSPRRPADGRNEDAEA